MNVAQKVGLIMANKSIFKIIIIISTLLLVSLCACTHPTNCTKNSVITFPSSNGRIRLEGEFPIAKVSASNSCNEYEILPYQQDEFVLFLKNQQYYRGEFYLDNSFVLPNIGNTSPFKVNDSCLVFSHKSTIWIGKKYANKFFYIGRIRSISVKGTDFVSEISGFLISDKITNMSVNTEYATNLSWDEIKNLYSDFEIDENSHSIKINCDIYTNEEYPYMASAGLTRLFYNEDNNTIIILDEYTEV